MISVIVCTANGSGRLEGCLGSLVAAAAKAPADWELIVVDNGSKDATSALVEGWVSRAALPIRYVSEPRQGLSRARNAGVEMARCPLIAFTDDDCLVSPHWLAAIASEFADPSLAVLGGRVTLHDEGDQPVGIRAFTEPAEVLNLEHIRGHLIGCNMTVRRSVFDTIGHFDVRLGAGTRARSGEDLDFFYRCLRKGLRLRFSPRAHVLHAHGRRTPAAAALLGKGYLSGRGAFYVKHAARGDLEVLRHMYSEIRTLERDARACLLSGVVHYVLPR